MSLFDILKRFINVRYFFKQGGIEKVNEDRNEEVNVEKLSKECNTKKKVIKNMLIIARKVRIFV